MFKLFLDSLNTVLTKVDHRDLSLDLFNLCFFGVCFYVKKVVCDIINVDFYFYRYATLSCLVHPQQTVRSLLNNKVQSKQLEVENTELMWFLKKNKTGTTSCLTGRCN